ncbi:MAG: hypothetical protein Kow00121_38340 [Elainellaceae cyanobacterium]
MLTPSLEDINAIKQLHHQWIEAEKQGRGLDVLQYCTDDVRWIMPNSEVLIGKDAARPMLNDPETKIIEILTEDVEIFGSDRVASKTSRYTTRFTGSGSTAVKVASGIHLWILHKQNDGQWQVALVTWQSAKVE